MSAKVRLCYDILQHTPASLASFGSHGLPMPHVIVPALVLTNSTHAFHDLASAGCCESKTCIEHFTIHQLQDASGLPLVCSRPLTIACGATSPATPRLRQAFAAARFIGQKLQKLCTVQGSRLPGEIVAVGSWTKFPASTQLRHSKRLHNRS